MVEIEKNTEEKRKVCIIDDEDDIREIYLLTLEKEGFDAKGAINGEDGLRLIREQKPDIILLDLLMPVKNGIEVLEEMKKDEIICNIPVVILSNIDDEESMKAVGEFNTRFYLVKSLATPQKVVNIVKEVLHRGGE